MLLLLLFDKNGDGNPSVKKWYRSTAMTSCFARAAFSDVVSLKLMAPRN
jgi:hypothetical protein